jgi:predicted transposase YbfD/YdcC
MDREQCTTLMTQLEDVPDPRHARGKQYEWRVLLAILAAALLSGQKTVWGIVTWAVSHAGEIIKLLDIRRRRIPSASCFYRVLSTVSIAELEWRIAVFGQQQDAADPTVGNVTVRQGEVLRGQAVDGKDVRGARAHGNLTFLVSLVRHGSGISLGQVAVPQKTNEIAAVPVLLAGRALRGTLTTLDALLAQRTLARQILAQSGDYLMVVKKNQPETYAAIELLFRSPPLCLGEEDRLTYSYQEKGHGRLETRTLECSALLSDYLDWPGVAQVMRRTCQRRHLRSGVVEREVTYGLTSLSRSRAGPQHLEAFWRSHWTIENRNHYVRDETMGEDRCQLHTGHGAQALAAFRNGILTLLRSQGRENIAAALRHFANSPQLALRTIGAIAT